MENKNKVWYIISAVIGILAGISYALTLILIPLAIYCFIGAKKYLDLAECSEGELTKHKQSLTNWAIYFSIVAFPFGLISIAPACLISNNVTVSNVETHEFKTETTEAEQHTEKREPVKNELSDLETLEKLKKLLDEGLITEEEYERAKKEVLEKK